MENRYWDNTGTEQAKYDEMENAGWGCSERTAKANNAFNSYYRYYNDGDLPGWARGKHELTKPDYLTGWRVLNEKGQEELERRATEAILSEYKRFKKAQEGGWN